MIARSVSAGAIDFKEYPATDIEDSAICDILSGRAGVQVLNIMGDDIMPKGQQKSNREVRKPKASKTTAVKSKAANEKATGEVISSIKIKK